jgi:hypothetical protein
MITSRRGDRPLHEFDLFFVDDDFVVEREITS